MQLEIDGEAQRDSPIRASIALAQHHGISDQLNGTTVVPLIRSDVPITRHL